MHLSSLEKMQDFRQAFLDGREAENLTVYDLGSQDVNGSYRQIFNEKAWSYIGLDMEEGRNVDIVLRNPYDWKEIPANSGDVLISGQAFEHIRFFWLTMLEIRRVLKPGGLCCIIAPSGGHEHRYPVDCWRFYPDGFEALAAFAGLEVRKISTQWLPDPRYTEESNEWRDSVLICEKTRRGAVVEFKSRVRDFLLKRFCLPRLG